MVEKAGVRLDKYVTEKHPELSRSQVQKLIRDGYIKVTGGVAKAGLKLNQGDKLTISLPPPAPSPLSP